MYNLPRYTNNNKSISSLMYDLKWLPIQKAIQLRIAIKIQKAYYSREPLPRRSHPKNGEDHLVFKRSAKIFFLNS